MGWYVDELRATEVRLRPRARALVEMLGFGNMPPITPGNFDAVMELLEADVLLHTTYTTLPDRIRHLGETVEANDPR